MLNPILGALNQSRLAGQITPIKNLMQSAQNPQLAANQILQQNPKLREILNANGGDAQKAFYALAQQLGVNGDDILNMLK